MALAYIIVEHSKLIRCCFKVYHNINVSDDKLSNRVETVVYAGGAASPYTCFTFVKRASQVFFASPRSILVFGL